jgi:hypothetical protein
MQLGARRRLPWQEEVEEEWDSLPLPDPGTPSIQQILGRFLFPKSIGFDGFSHGFLLCR